MKVFSRISVLTFFLILIACDDDDFVGEIPESDAKEISSFVFNTDDNTVLDETVSASIDQTNKTISTSVPNGTDISALIPTIVVSEKASVSPVGAQDFSIPVTYVVTAENGTTASYTASVTVLEADNSAPLAFSLSEVPDNALDVDLLPTFSWEISEDPDGDVVTYDLFLNTGNTPDMLYAENITEPSYQLTEPLNLSQSYVWRVVAKDPLGATVSSVSRSFTTRDIRFNTPAVTGNAQFTGRNSHTSVVFDNKLWVIGGADENFQLKNDVWFSEDGTTWTEATSAAGFSERNDHSSVIFDNKIWVIGGFDGSLNYKNDVWFSEDGINWTEAVTEAPFDPRSNHTSVVFDNKIWVIGGIASPSNFRNDVWYSEDGINWVEATNAANFQRRSGHSSHVFEDKMWVIGGVEQGSNRRQNDVWFSEDGINWDQVTNAAPFDARNLHSTVVFNNQLWVIGGLDQTITLRNDVWFSNDGINWTETSTSAPFTGRESHTSIVFENKIWTIGGRDIVGKQSDIWTFE